MCVCAEEWTTTRTELTTFKKYGRHENVVQSLALGVSVLFGW
jgi:hypothetical protein